MAVLTGKRALITGGASGIGRGTRITSPSVGRVPRSPARPDDRAGAPGRRSRL